VALLLPTPVAHEVDGLRRALGDASRTRVAPHITLVPPVNVRQEHLGAALAVVRAAAAAAPGELTATLGPPDSFLPANAVLYLPVAGDLPALEKLRERVWAPPLTRTLTWPFVPHVTLADEAPAERIAAAVAAMADYQVTATFDRVHLLVERRPEGGPGPQWVPLADVAFGPPAIVARGGPLAVELTRSCLVDPEAQALLVGTAAGALAADDSEGIVVTARREGGVVGVGRAWLAADGCRAAVVVAGEHRNQGIGRHIAAALEAAAADAGWACQFPRTLTEDPAG
jgi:2'-5' RNA ligase/GNAT superfamily N-acetyltransferase